ncbi:MAG: hypothetical protein ACFCUX_01220 [Candidatus Methylacidiphilales bacterium]
MIHFSIPNRASAALVRLETTPYDRQLEPVRHVLKAGPIGQHGQESDLELINKAMTEAYRLPYANYREWMTPEQTDKQKRADCKGRAVLLHDRLNAAGIGSHRLVIGRVKGGNSESHTWLVWRTQDTEYLLDPTFYRKAIPMSKVASDRYVAEYIYSGGYRYGYVSNRLIFDGLPDLPAGIRERSQNTRVFLAEEQKQKRTENPSREVVKAPPLERQKQQADMESDSSSSAEVPTTPMEPMQSVEAPSPDKEEPSQASEDRQPRDPSLALR